MTTDNRELITRLNEASRHPLAKSGFSGNGPLSRLLSDAADALEEAAVPVIPLQAVVDALNGDNENTGYNLLADYVRKLGVVWSPVWGWVIPKTGDAS